MHRAAKPLLKTCFSGKNFGKCSVNKKIDCHFFYVVMLSALFNSFQHNSTHVRFHYTNQFFVIQFLNSRKTFSQYFSMTSVRAVYMIIPVKQVCLTDRRSLLPYRKMSRSRMLILFPLVFSGGFNKVEHNLEFTDDCHIPVNS